MGVGRPAALRRRRHGGCTLMARARRCPAAWRGEQGQAAVLAALSLGVLLVLATAVALGVATLVQARASLAAAADAAAVAARQSSARVALVLDVTYLRYTCAYRTAARVLSCQAPQAGSATVTADASAFVATAGSGFGPEPGWARAAGCAGTVWTPPHQAGTWRICTAQSLAAASVGAPDPAALWPVAQAWLQANLRDTPQLERGRVTDVRVGAAGQVTVTARADLATPLWGRRSIAAVATAWPGA